MSGERCAVHGWSRHRLDVAGGSAAGSVEPFTTAGSVTVVAADRAAAAWVEVAKELAGELPGDLGAAPEPVADGAVREPVGWTLTWMGLSRPRNTTKRFVMAGVVPLVEPFGLTGAPYGLRSDTARTPGTFDLLSDALHAEVLDFALKDALPVLERWTPEVLAERAEADLVAPAGERQTVEFTQAAGWRVVDDSGSPIEPARASAQLLRERGGEEDAGWFEALIAAWEQGGRASALTYLDEQRSVGLIRLKLA